MAHLPEHIVTKPAELAECCEHLARCKAFGFDTEFIGEDYYHPQLCLVQVATRERLYILDPLELTALDPFWELVADAKHVTVVHAGREEIRMCQLHLGRPPAHLFDLQVAAGLLGAGYPAGHAAIVQQFLRVRLAKGETLTDWARRPLTRQQVRYAYDDVRHLMPLYDRLHKKLAELDRLAWAEEEFAALARRSLADDPEREPWRKLRGLGSLDRRQLAVVREVFAWREERARKINRPARIVLRDDLVVEVAKRLPEAERDLAVMRGMTRHDLPGLLAAVQRGRAVADQSLPAYAERDNDPPQVALVASLLSAVLASWCAEAKLTPALTATSQDIKMLVRARLAGQGVPADSGLAKGWRATHILPLLTEVLEGKRSVRVGRLGDPAPLEVSE
jgi:ribonuclease D